MTGVYLSGSVVDGPDPRHPRSSRRYPRRLLAFQEYPMHDFAPRETPFTQGAPLSVAEATGEMSVALGFVPSRRHQVPADWPSPVLRFLDSSNPRLQAARSRPSARRSAPRPPLSAA